MVTSVISHFTSSVYFQYDKLLCLVCLICGLWIVTGVTVHLKQAHLFICIVCVCVCVCVYKVASPFLPVWIPGVVYVADGKQRLRGGISSTHQAFREETREDH